MIKATSLLRHYIDGSLTCGRLAVVFHRLDYIVFHRVNTWQSAVQMVARAASYYVDLQNFSSTASLLCLLLMLTLPFVDWALGLKVRDELYYFSSSTEQAL